MISALKPVIRIAILAVLIITGKADAGSENIGQSIPAVTSFMLANGMQVVLLPDHRAPVVTHMVWYRVGAADEPPGKSGIAHFLEHLMFRGTSKIPPGEFSKIVSRNGGQDNAFTAQDYTGYFQRVAKDRLGLVMELEADRMINLKLTDEVVTTERDIILEERSSRTDNNPASQLGEQINASLYLAHPYANPVIGWRHEIENLTREDALAFYKRHYAPNNAVLVVAGDITEDELRPLAEQFYGIIPPNPDLKPRTRITEPPHRAERRIEFTDKRVTQPSFSRTYLAPSYATDQPGEAEAIDVLAYILGGSTSSRLYTELVLNQKSAVAAGAWYNGGGLDYGTFRVYGTPKDTQSTEQREQRGQTEQTEQIEQAIDQVIADLIERGVTREEVARAVNALVASAIYARDNQMTMARIFGASLISGESLEDVLQWPSRMKSVRVDDVNAVAKQILNRDSSVSAFLLPATTPQTAQDDLIVPPPPKPEQQ